jgi:flagellar protein FliS
MALNAYEVNRILNASPVELVRILYAAAIGAVGAARDHLAAGDIARRSREITRAQMILAELAGTVNRAGGGEIGERLLALYDYMLWRLADANARQTDAPLAEVERLLGALDEGWAGCEAPEEEALPAAS